MIEVNDTQVFIEAGEAHLLVERMVETKKDGLLRPVFTCLLAEEASVSV